MTHEGQYEYELSMNKTAHLSKKFATMCQRVNHSLSTTMMNFHPFSQSSSALDS